MNVNLNNNDGDEVICRCGAFMNVLSNKDDDFLECRCPKCNSYFKVPINKAIRQSVQEERKIKKLLSTDEYWQYPDIKINKKPIINKMKTDEGNEDYIGMLCLVFDALDTMEYYDCPDQEDWIEPPEVRSFEETPLKCKAQILEIVGLNEDGYPIFDKEINGYGTNEYEGDFDDLRIWEIIDMGDNKIEDFA